MTGECHSNQVLNNTIGDNIMEIRNLEYSYPDRTKALKGVSLNIRRGDKVAVMGANGSGKTTFFLCLNGVLKGEKGEIVFDGKKVEHDKKGLTELKRKVGIVFQDPDSQLFLPTVYQEVSFGPMNLKWDKDVVQKRVDDMLGKMNLWHLRDKPTHFLSGGEKKRVSIADVLVMEPEVMILDEPTAALDPRHARQIDGIIAELSQKGITLLISTHDVERALAWANTVVVFDEGQISAVGSPRDIFTRHDLLEKTHLEQPAVMQFFYHLVETHVLPPGLEVPTTMEELKGYIQEHRNL